MFAVLALPPRRRWKSGRSAASPMLLPISLGPDRVYACRSCSTSPFNRSGISDSVQGRYRSFGGQAANSLGEQYTAIRQQLCECLVNFSRRIDNRLESFLSAKTWALYNNHDCHFKVLSSLILQARSRISSTLSFTPTLLLSFLTKCWTICSFVIAKLPTDFSSPVTTRRTSSSDGRENRL